MLSRIVMDAPCLRRSSTERASPWYAAHMSDVWPAVTGQQGMWLVRFRHALSIKRVYRDGLVKKVKKGHNGG